MTAAEVTVTGVLKREGREGPLKEILRGTLAFDDGEIVVVVRDGELRDVLTGVGQDSTVRIRGKLVQHRWKTGNGRGVSEIQLQPEEVTVIEDSRRQGTVG